MPVIPPSTKKAFPRLDGHGSGATATQTPTTRRRLSRPVRAHLNRTLPRRMAWTRPTVPRRRTVPLPPRPAGRRIERPSVRSSLLYLGTTLGTAAVLWSLGALFQTAYAGRIYPHITIDSVPVGGMTRQEALAALQETQARRESQPIAVLAGARTYAVPPSRFAARYNLAAAVDRALVLAHHGPLFFGGWTEAGTIVAGQDLALSGAYDHVAVDNFLGQVADETHVVPRGAVVGVRGTTPDVLVPAAPGQRLAAMASAVLGRAIARHDTAPLTLPMQRVDSALGPAQADVVLAKARNLVAAPIIFRYTVTAPTSWKLTRANIAHLLTFSSRCVPRSCAFVMSIDVRKLAQAFVHGGVAKSVQREPSPASFLLYAGAGGVPAVKVAPDSPGQIIDNRATAAQVLTHESDPPGEIRIVYLLTQATYAPFNMQAATALNMIANVGSTSFYLDGLNAQQQHNVGLAANLANNTLVGPGQTFDLAAVAGPFNAAGAYTMGLNRVDANDTTGVNGGVGQLGSALLGAAFDAGLPIVRRDPYPYLDLFTPPGLDTTISYPPAQGRHPGAQDLIFRNTTDHALLVMTDVSSLSQGRLGVYLFNAPGYAPGHVQSTPQYTVSGGDPTITLNPDGSADVTRTRTLTIPGHGGRSDSLSSHYESLDN